VEEIKRTTGIELDIEDIPFDDAKTYQIFQEGQTYGIFQFESSGMRDILRKAKPQRLDDLIALNALYRPGPLRSGMVDDFIARKQGKTEVKYELPELEPILSDTYGVIAYQEQVMRISNVVAGFTLGEADILRKAMGKKKADVMQKMRDSFVQGAKKNGTSEKKAGYLFELMEHFAGYGFNKSHSTAYAFLAYQTAYLKANYPRHFAASLLTIEAANTDKRVFESLIKAGAFDSLAKGTAHEALPSTALRPRLMAAIDAACDYGARAQRDREQGQAQLFGGFDDDSVAVAAAGDGCKAVPLPEATPWTEAEQLAFEKETLGLYWSGHPVDRYASALRAFGAKSVADLSETQAAARDSSWEPGGPKPIEPDTSIGGIVAAVRPLKTKKGDRMAVFTLEDAQGSVEIIAFPEPYQRAAGMIEPGTMVLVRGKLERDDETSRILASEVAPIESVREKLAREVAIPLRKPADRDTPEALVAIFSRHRGDRKVSFDVETGEAPNRLRVKVDLSSQIRVRPSPALIQDIEQVVGEGAVELR